MQNLLKNTYSFILFLIHLKKNVDKKSFFFTTGLLKVLWTL